MNVEDLILVSVDDHVVEPPDMFDDHLPAKYARPGAQGHPDRGRATTSGSTRARRSRTSGSTPSPAGRPRSTASSRRRSTRSGRVATTSTSASRDMNANGVLGSMCFPSFPQFCGQLFSRTEDKDVGARDAPGLQRLAHRRVVRVRRRAGSSRWRSRRSGTRSSMADEVRRVAAKGCHAVTFSREPGEAGLAELPQRPLGPVLAGVLRRGHDRLPAHRLVVAAGHDRGRRADRRDDHAAADQHRAGRGRPPLVAGAAQVPRPRGSRCPRAASAGSRTSSSGSTTSTQHHRRGPARTSATSCRARSSSSGSISASSTTPSGWRTATTSASTASAGSATTRTRTRPGRRRRSCCASRSQGSPTTRSTR